VDGGRGAARLRGRVDNEQCLVGVDGESYVLRNVRSSSSAACRSCTRPSYEWDKRRFQLMRAGIASQTDRQAENRFQPGGRSAEWIGKSRVQATCSAGVGVPGRTRNSWDSHVGRPRSQLYQAGRAIYWLGSQETRRQPGRRFWRKVTHLRTAIKRAWLLRSSFVVVCLNTEYRDST